MLGRRDLPRSAHDLTLQPSRWVGRSSNHVPSVAVQAGWDFWTNQITVCGTDAACTEVRRINVSASFFLSIEFQDTGYLVERIYKAAYGDATSTSTFNGQHNLATPIHSSE
jgi:hypothetical protein